MTASWTWTCLDAEGSPVTTPEAAGFSVSPGDFPSQGDAETWLGEQWRELADGGVESVSLHRDGELVYGPMSLRSAG